MANRRSLWMRYFLTQYQCFPICKTCRLTTSHVGPMIGVKRTLDSQQLYFNCDVNGSITICSVWIDRKKFCFRCCYLLSTNCNYSHGRDSLENLLRTKATFRKIFDDLLIYGDFNFVSKNWKSSSSDDTPEIEYLQHPVVIILQQEVNFDTVAIVILEMFYATKGIQIIGIQKSEDHFLQRFSNHSPIGVSLNSKSFSSVSRQNIVKGTYSFCSGD